MGGAPQVAMRVASQIWQIVFASQTFQVFCFCFANPSSFSFGPLQKGTICSSDQEDCQQLQPTPQPKKLPTVTTKTTTRRIANSYNQDHN
jgi:hypothetical protein